MFDEMRLFKPDFEFILSYGTDTGKCQPATLGLEW